MVAGVGDTGRYTGPSGLPPASTYYTEYASPAGRPAEPVFQPVSRRLDSSLGEER